MCQALSVNKQIIPDCYKCWEENLQGAARESRVMRKDLPEDIAC